MKTTNTLFLKFLALGIALAVAPLAMAHADYPNGTAGDHPASFGPRAAYYMPKDGDNIWYGGAQLRLYMAPALGLEGSIDYRREKFGNGVTADVYPVQASLLAYLIDRKPFSLFILGGGGWYFTRINQGNGDHTTNNRFGPHAGAGVQVFLNDYWSIDGTYRYVWLESFSSHDNSNPLTKDYHDEGSMLTAAINYHF